MRIFVAGATGAVGKRLVPLLVEAGHEVTAMTRSASKVDGLRAVGAQPVIADALDRPSVLAAVMRAEPEVVIHELTAIAGLKSFRNFDRAFAPTNRLRVEGTDHLLEAAVAAGASRFVAQSYGNWNYGAPGSPPKVETDPFEPAPVLQQESVRAVQHLERAVLAAEELDGIVLRYGTLYGPGTNLSLEGEFAEMIRRRRLPIVGKGDGMSSFLHVDDAATATFAAIERGAPGVYNVVDDEPVAMRVWLPALAAALGAPAPRRLPRWIVRLAAGEVAVAMMSRTRGASNAKAKRELGWQPGYASYREGFSNGLGDLPVPHLVRHQERE